MSARPALWIGLLALCPPAAAAQERPSHRDFVFLASDRPVLIRFHLRSSGRPYYDPWENYTGKLFAYLDADGNGALEKKEADRIPQGSFLNTHLQGILLFNEDAPVAPADQVDADRDGKVTLAEFRSYLRNHQFVPLRITYDVQADAARRLTDRMYQLLDEDADGLLSPAELARGPEALRKADANADEMLVGAELGGGGPAIYGVAPPAVAPAAPDDGRNPRTFIPVEPGSEEQLARWLLERYDADLNGRLGPKEAALGEQAAGLDADRDGSLDARELEGFAGLRPDVELSALAGDTSKGSLAARVLRGVGLTDGPDRVAVFNPDRRPMPLAARAARLDNSTLVFAWGDAEVEVQVSPPRTSDVFGGTRGYYFRQFRQAAGEEKKVERKKAMQDFALRGLFVFADGDRDDTLTEKELLAYLDLQKGGSDCTVVVSAVDLGRSLLESLDADADERLSPRELLEGWRRLRPDPKDSKGFDRGEMPRRVRVVIGQGQAGYRRVAPPKAGGLLAAGPPSWFTHMDRNGDGDLSPREFLGAASDFRKLDADGDGLVSAEEARKGEKAAR